MATQEQKDVWKQQIDNCNRFFDAVAEQLKDTHVVVESKSKKYPCRYLVAKGEENQITYYGKPVNSLRVGSNWNWRAGLDRCSNPTYIQCVTPDLPYARKRSKENPEWSTLPVFGNMIGYFDTDNKYHCVYGERYDFSNKSWMWVENYPAFVVNRIRTRAKELQEAMAQK